MDGFTTPEAAQEDLLRTGTPSQVEARHPASIPEYLQRVYWWAYLEPGAVRFFDRQWLINLILWGNYKTLRDTALAEFSGEPNGHILQLACVYGDFSPRLAVRLSEDESLSVVDVAQIQLDNLRRKLGAVPGVTLHRQNSAELCFESDSFDSVVLFFLLHEQPHDVRIRTLREAIRVVRPGGKLVIMDYHRPKYWHPLRHFMMLVLRTLEPFAMDLWDTEIRDWLPTTCHYDVRKETFFGGLYQKLIIKPH